MSPKRLALNVCARWTHTGKVDMDNGIKPRCCASKKRTIRNTKKKIRKFLDCIEAE